MKPRSYTQRTPTQQKSSLNRSHIVQASLDKRDKLLNKYQTQLQDLVEQIDSKQPYKKANTVLKTDRSARKQRALSSLRKDTIPVSMESDNVNNPMKDYQKLILGLQYALEGERNKNEELTQKNLSLESEISNLRNLLMGPDEHKHYEKTAFKESQDKINYLQARVLEQKKNYQFIIDSKNQTIVSLENQIKTLKNTVKDKDANNDKALSRRVLELMGELQQMKNQLTRKNIQIERMKYQKLVDSDSDDEEITKIRKVERLKFYLQQLQISNKLILRKNVEILMLSNKVMNYEKIMDVIEMYLDKKQVKGVDLSILEHSCVNKLRILLREKAVFQRELLNQLNDHNKKISNFQVEILGRDKLTSEKMSEVITDNKRLANTVTNLQSTIANLEKQLENSRSQNQILANQITINKRQFIEEVTKLKEQMSSISSVTKNQFDRMKIQNLKLAQQNRSLLFLVGEKERQIHKKGQAIKTFEQYREKINTLDVSEKDKRKIQMTSEDNPPQIGTKLMLINNFSNWLFEWNKIKNWANKKTLLNLILDKQEIRGDAIQSMGYLINVIHECLLQSRNVEIQERAIILLSHFIQHNILKNQNLYLGKISPIIVRGFRPIIQGQQDVKHRVLNQSTLRICNELQKNSFKWSYQMTNEMLSVNGLKYLFGVIRKTQVDELVEFSYNVLIMIAKQNQMISFMMSFDINTLIFSNITPDYTFIIFLLTLVKTLLQGNDYLKAQTSLLQYKKLFDILAADDDEQLLELTLDCINLLMQKNTLFTQSLQKIKAISILSEILRKNNDQSSFSLLKKAGKAYIDVVTELQSQNINKYIKGQIDKLLQIVRLKKFNENRFARILKVIAKVVSIIYDSPELDDKVFSSVSIVFANYENIQTEGRIKANEIINVIFERNKDIVNKYSNDTLINNLVEAYKLSNNHEQLVFLLKILLFEEEQKRTTEILRTGRQSFINKLINDSLASDYNITISALKVLLLLSKEKYSEKFINKAIINNIVNKVLNERGEQEYIGLTLSILYFFCKNDALSEMAIDSNIVQKISNVILERHDKEPLIFKSFAVLEVCHTTHYKKKILNYFIASDGNLQILKTISFILRKAKNKVQMGTRAVFIYDYLNNKNVVESLALLTERNDWMIEDLILLRNQYIGKVDAIVYKIEMLLHEMSQVSNKVRRIYQKFKVQGEQSQEQNQ